jgi:hypothetical protein
MEEQKKSTPAVKMSFNPFWDHLLFWELKNVTLDQFEYGKINLSLYNTNTSLRSDLIGTNARTLSNAILFHSVAVKISFLAISFTFIQKKKKNFAATDYSLWSIQTPTLVDFTLIDCLITGSFEFDLMNIYERPNRELHKTWVALTDPTDKNEGVQVCQFEILSLIQFLQNSNCCFTMANIIVGEMAHQALVRLSIIVVGPGDQLVQHDEKDDADVSLSRIYLHWHTFFSPLFFFGQKELLHLKLKLSICL